MSLKKIFVAGMGFLSVFAGAEVNAKMQLRVLAGKSSLQSAPDAIADGAYGEFTPANNDSILELDRARLELHKSTGPFHGMLRIEKDTATNDAHIKVATASYKFDDMAKLTVGKLSHALTATFNSAISPNTGSSAFGGIAGINYGDGEYGKIYGGSGVGLAVSGSSAVADGTSFAYDARVWESLKGKVNPTINNAMSAADITFDATGSTYALAMAVKAGLEFANDMGSAAMSLSYAKVPEAAYVEVGALDDDAAIVPVAVALFEKTDYYQGHIALASAGFFAEAESVMKRFNFTDASDTLLSAATDANFKDLKIDSYLATVGYVVTGQQRHAKAFALSGVNTADNELAVEVYANYSYAKNTLGNTKPRLILGEVSPANAHKTFEHKASDYSVGVNAYMGPFAIKANHLMVSSDKYTSSVATKEVTEGSKTVVRFDLSI